MNKSRQQFDEWFAPQKEEMVRNGLSMLLIRRMRRRQLSAWQASRESLEVELPDKYTLEYMQDDLSDCECDFFKCDDVKNELSNNGVKIKNG